MPGRVLVVDDSATVRKIVRAVLEDASYEVTDAPDGQIALEIIQRETFDLVLVDFVMPRLNGYQLAQAMRSITHLRTLPIVLMSAKADSIGERFMRQTGAVDAITKPFPPEAVLAVVAHALARRESGRPAPTLVRDQLQVAPSTDDDPLGDLFGDGPREHTQTDAFRNVTTDLDLGGAVPLALAQAGAAHRFVDVLTPLLVGAGLDEAHVHEALTRIATPATLAQIAREVKTFDADLRGPSVFEGSMKQVPLGEVMQLLRLQRHTGLLVVQRESSEVGVAFRDGNIDVALARNVSSEFLLGRYLMADRLIARADLEALLARRRPDAGWLGEQLVRDGVISVEDLGRALTRQTSEIIYEMLRWPDGWYRFEYRVVPPEALNARLGLPVESIVLEGFRRVDEWRVIEQEVRSFDDVLLRDDAAIDGVGLERLSNDERVLLDATDGRRTVREVVEAAAMNSFDGCRIVYRLLRARLVRRRGS